MLNSKYCLKLLPWTLVLVGLALPALAQEFSESVSLQADKLFVANLIGEIIVEQATGNSFEVEVNVRGDDASHEHISIKTKEGKEAAVVIQFPVTEEQNYVYPALGAGGKAQITIRDEGRGTDNWFHKIFGTGGKKINVVVPNDKGALKAYNAGKQFYFARRGQLNFSCAHCHFDAAGKYIRANILSAGLGQATNFPVYRSKWGGLGTMHRRYGGCNKQVRAKPFKAQKSEYTNLEYFHTYMSNGLKLNAPSNRQ